MFVQEISEWLPESLPLSHRHKPGRREFSERDPLPNPSDSVCIAENNNVCRDLGGCKSKALRVCASPVSRILSASSRTINFRSEHISHQLCKDSHQASVTCHIRSHKSSPYGACPEWQQKCSCDLIDLFRPSGSYLQAEKL